MSDYFDKRDIKNTDKIEEILKNDLPDYCREYFVGISMNTSTLTRKNYAYDIRTFFKYMCTKIYRFKVLKSQSSPKPQPHWRKGSWEREEVKQILGVIGVPSGI